MIGVSIREAVLAEIADRIRNTEDDRLESWGKDVPPDSPIPNLVKAEQHLRLTEKAKLVRIGVPLQEVVRLTVRQRRDALDVIAQLKHEDGAERSAARVHQNANEVATPMEVLSLDAASDAERAEATARLLAGDTEIRRGRAPLGGYP